MPSSQKPRCVFFDRNSIDLDDLDWSAIQSSTDFTSFDHTTPEQVTRHGAQAEIIISNKIRLGTREFAALPDLRLVCVIATGTNNIDHQAAAAHGVEVRNVQDYAAASVSQHVMMLMLVLATRFVDYQQDIREGRWQTQDQFCLLDHPIQSLQGETLGLIGYGHIARAVEQKARAFGMEVIISQSLRAGAAPQPGRVSFAELLERSDFISLHCPLSEWSRNRFGENEFSAMKPGAFIINTARGGIINEAALLQAIQQGEIAGAALDCIEQEPPAADNPIILANLPNLIITPHNAWGTRQARQKLVDGTARNIQQYIEQKSIVQDLA